MMVDLGGVHTAFDLFMCLCDAVTVAPSLTGCCKSESSDARSASIFVNRGRGSPGESVVSSSRWAGEVLYSGFVTTGGMTSTRTGQLWGRISSSLGGAGWGQVST